MMTKTEAAISEGRTLFPMKTKSAAVLGKTENVLKIPGKGNKLGRKITKGKWKGFKIFILTLEERATCPPSCFHWGTCYGNNMPFATRYLVDVWLLHRIWSQLTTLQRKNPLGFAIRLHILGDFFSVEYVEFWRKALNAFPALRIWGYTGRIDKDDPVHVAISSLRRDESRFRIRWSGDVSSPKSALSYDNVEVRRMVEEKNAFLCPEQQGKTESCATCCGCWENWDTDWDTLGMKHRDNGQRGQTKPVVFTTH